MTNRQTAIFDLLEKVDLTADVGCDHGILSLKMLQNGVSNRVLATDISAPSLSKTEKLLTDFGYRERAEFVCIDGLPKETTPDQILIAGMGGNEICKILATYFAGRAERPILVLQPMRDFIKVRRLLNTLGYKIIVDKIIFDKKFYLLLKAVAGEQVLSECELYLGADSTSYQDAEYIAWLDEKIAKTTAILQKITPNDAKYNELNHFLKLCKELKGSKKC